MKHKGYIAIILDPGRLYTEHGVVDLEKNTLVARCSDERDADRIADSLREAEVQREARRAQWEADQKQLTAPQS